MTRLRLEKDTFCDRITMTIPHKMAQAMKAEQLRLGYPNFSEFMREVWKAYKKSESANQVFLVDHLRYRENTAADRLRATTMRNV